MMYNIVISGVGGQGTLLASRILGHIATALGHDVKVSEVHGMAQRGGSVITYVRYGDKVYSPIISPGQADVLLAFEQIEAARWLHLLKKGGRLIVNSQKIAPMPVITGSAVYPDNILGEIADAKVELIVTDALKIAESAGNAKAVNIVLLGVMARHMELDKKIWEEAIRATVPAKFLSINLKAFDMGYQID